MKLPDSWHGNWAGLEVAILGLGKSGFSAADALSQLGCKVTVFAKDANADLKNLLEVMGVKLIESDLIDEFEAHSKTIDFVVTSPGFLPSHPIIQSVLKSQKPLLTDIDLAFLIRDRSPKVAKWILITGTNGKTTTTELVNHILLESGFRSAAVGNIGTPIVDAMLDEDGFDYLVVEVSSFQLHYLGPIEPEVSAFLNFAPDHIDWHGSLEKYFEAKAKVFNNTRVAIIFNEQDRATLQAAQEADVVEGCRAVSFTLATPARSMVGFVEEFLVDRAFIDDRDQSALEIAQLEDFSSMGIMTRPMRANIAAATAIVRAIGVGVEAIRQGLSSFRVPAHRMQLVALINEIAYVDDSKATNAHAANGSLDAFDSIVWIAGGLLKGTDPTPLIRDHGKKLRAVILIGKDTAIFEELLAKMLPNLPVEVVKNPLVMATAVGLASKLALPGDTVLLAPAAASMDQFIDYVDRGNQFQAQVRELALQ